MFIQLQAVAEIIYTLVLRIIWKEGLTNINPGKIKLQNHTALLIFYVLKYTKQDKKQGTGKNI